MIFALAAFTTAFAQENKNEKQETVVTKTAVKSENGKDVSTKAVTQTEKQVVALETSDANQTNQDVVLSPVKVNTNVNYSNEGTNYTFQTAPVGYKMITTDAGSLRIMQLFALHRKKDII